VLTSLDANFMTKELRWSI